MFGNPPLRVPPARSSVAERTEHYTIIIRCQDLGITVKGFLPEQIQIDARANYEAPFAQGLNGAHQTLGNTLRLVGVNLTSQALTAQVWQGSEPIQFNIPLVLQAETDVNDDVLEPMAALLKLTWPRSSGAGSLLKAPGPSIDTDRLVANLNPALTEKLNASSARFAGSASKALDAFNEQRSASRTAVDKANSGNQNRSSLLQSGLDTLIHGSTSLIKGGSELVKGAEGLLAPMAELLRASTKNIISLSIGKYLYFDSVVITDVQMNHEVMPTIDNRTVGNYQHVECTVGIRTYLTPTQNDIKLMFPSATFRDSSSGATSANSPNQERLSFTSTTDGTFVPN